MKKPTSFFKKFHHLYLTLGLGLGLSVSQFTAIYLPQNPVISMRENRKYSSKIPGPLQMEAFFNSFTSSGKKEPGKLPVKKSKAKSINPDFKTIISNQGRHRFKKAMVMEATAYYPGPECTGKNSIHGRTYTGKKARYGLVAVDPRVIPLGSRLYIENYGPAEAADIGGAIKGNRIDLCYETYREAIKFGRKKIKVYLLE